MHSPPPEPEPEPEELARFREAWRKELEERKAQSSGKDQVTDILEEATRSPAQPGGADNHPGPSAQSVARSPVAAPLQLSHGKITLRPNLTAAVDVYRRAAQLEQQSQLDDAIQLYRQAFRMDPNVDKAYHNIERDNLVAAASAEPSKSHRRARSSIDGPAIDKLTHAAFALSLKPAGPHVAFVTGALANVLADFPANLKFEPEDEKEGVLIDIIPDEMLVLILRCLHPPAIERFAAVSRKARVLSLDSAIWRELVQMTYKPPQISVEFSADEIVEDYAFDYRRMYIEHPRVRLDGVYIAVCHYTREGRSDNAWVNIRHLITYHRYLRFLPDGRVLSLLANEEVQPQDMIPLLKPTLRMTGFSIGTWRLDDATVFVTNLVDASSKNVLAHGLTSEGYYEPMVKNGLPHGPGSEGHHEPVVEHAPSNFASRYVFQMTLTLRSRPMGRWNKLDFDQYDSVDLQTGDVIALGLKHERPFWFSKVRSYA